MPSFSASFSRNRTVGMAMFAAGTTCEAEAAFCTVPGVLDTTVGFVGLTGHAEAVRVEFDPARVSYEQLLQMFWELHDPTEIGNAGQHRSAIYFHSPEQHALALASRARRQLGLERPIPTEIVRAGPFFRAESEYRRYLERRSGALSHA